MIHLTGEKTTSERLKAIAHYTQVGTKPGSGSLGGLLTCEVWAGGLQSHGCEDAGVCRQGWHVGLCHSSS